MAYLPTHFKKCNMFEIQSNLFMSSILCNIHNIGYYFIFNAFAFIFQLYENAMINAGLMEDPRSMVGRLNELLEKALEKH